MANEGYVNRWDVSAIPGILCQSSREKWSRRTDQWDQEVSDLHGWLHVGVSF